MAKFADDTYLIVSASNITSCASEITIIEQGANNNNLPLNRGESAEIVFVSQRSRREQTLSPPIAGFERIDANNALGASYTCKLFVIPHVDEVLFACAKTLFALRTLWQHGLPNVTKHDIFLATVVAKMTCASQAWWGYANAADRVRVERFFRRCVRLGFRSASSATHASDCDEADDRLLACINHDPQHLIRPLLPPTTENHYNLRTHVITTYNFLQKHLL